MNSQTSRRTFLGSAAVLGSAALLKPRASLAAKKPVELKLGICSYSFGKAMPLPEVIEATKRLKVRSINIKPEFHLPFESSPQQIAEAVKMLEDAGLELAGTGTTYFLKNDEPEIRQRFDYNKALRSPLIVIGPTVETLPTIEKMVKEYNIKVAIHNHGPSDKHFPTPQSALAAIKGMDPRVGLCIDIGHTTRAGVDVVASAKEAGSKLLDMHVKDIHRAESKWDDNDVGAGEIPIAALFRQLEGMHFSGHCNLEYEVKTPEKLAGMQNSFSYLRGVLAGLSVGA